MEGQYQIIKNVKFGKDCKVWNYVNLYDCEFGDNTSIGSFCEIYGSKIGNNVRFQAHCFVPEGVTIEDNVFFSPRVTIFNDSKPPSHGKYWKKTLIKEGAVIGGSVSILPGVIIGENAVVGAGSLVTKSVPDNEVWMGSPAKFYKKVKDL